MWNKAQSESEESQARYEPTPPASPAPQVERQAVLGPSIFIKGSLSGKEDLLIEGRVEGEVSFKQHTVTVGKRGRVDADLYCKRIFVEGEVRGNLHGEELVVVRKSGRVKGNAVAPRVSLEDGCEFQGSIDMQPESRKPDAPAKEPRKPQTKTGAGAPENPAGRPAQATPATGSID